MKIVKFNENNNFSFNDFEEMEKIRREIVQLRFKYDKYFDKIKPDLEFFLEENQDELGIELELGFKIEDMRIVFNNKQFAEDDYLEIFYRDVDNIYEEEPDSITLTKEDIDKFFVFLNAKKYNL